MKKLFCLCIILISCFAFSSVYASNTFYDTRGTKYEGVVERMAKLGIINGMSETTYAPNRSVTRAELAKIIVKMKGIEDYAEDVEYRKLFSDVKADDWFYPYVTVAAELELVNGYEDGTFKPNKEVTYAEMVVILLRYLGYTRISEDSPNGWYWNYIVRMREIELNDNVGEFNYTAPAKRGDVAMFAWNALITDRWAIISENENDGFTYTYSKEAPLEMYFGDYRFLDNETISSLAGEDGKAGVVVNNVIYTTSEKVPLYVLGGKVTALYDEEEEELIGVTFDEDYEDCKIISGPVFYLKDEGYNLSKSKDVAYYGSKNDASYAYLVMNKDKTEILRTVYLDSSNSILVESISVKEESGDIDDSKLIKKVTLNEEEFTSVTTALVKDGFSVDWSELEKESIITDLGNGLYVYGDKSLKEIVSDINYKNEIWLDGEKYIISENCICYVYNEKEVVSYNTLTNIKDYIGTEATVYFNVAEEVCKIEFEKTQKDNEKYLIGYITDVRNYSDESKQTIYVGYGEDEQKRFNLNVGKSYYMEGELVAIIEGEDNVKCTIIEKDIAFDNDISVKYNYDAKEITNKMIGEYILTDDTKYYKVTLKYENNSITKINECKIEVLDLDNLDNIEDLMAYQINLIYNEDMEVLTVYAVNEINKFENRIALVKDKKQTKVDDEKYTYKITLSVTESYVTSYEISDKEFAKYRIGDIVIFSLKDEDDEESILFEEAFKYESIGYKRDLVVEDIDKNSKDIKLSDGSIMDLNEDVYNWNGSKINLNKYRFVLAKVSKDEDGWNFKSLDMFDKEDIKVEIGDRFAIGEIDGVIVIYRGYEE